MTTERRRSPRIEIVDRLEGHSVTHEAPVRVRDFSLGGMAIETSVAFAVGDVQTFSVMLGDGSTVELHGRIVRCRSLAAEGEPPLFHCGVQFVDDDAQVSAGVIDRLRT
jgi:hypothetical protein